MKCAVLPESVGSAYYPINYGTGQLEGVGHCRLEYGGRNGDSPHRVLIHGPLAILFVCLFILLFGSYSEPFLRGRLGGRDRFSIHDPMSVGSRAGRCGKV